MSAESEFEDSFLQRVAEFYPGCVIIKNYPGYCQGFPDRLILYKDKWVALEFKASINASHQPNQDYYVGILDEMSYGTFVYPENQAEVLDAIQQTFGFTE